MSGRDNILIIIFREDSASFGVGVMAFLAILFALGQIAFIVGLIAAAPLILIQTIVCLVITCLISISSNKHIPIICALVTLIATLAVDAVIMFPVNENTKEIEIMLIISFFFSDIGSAILAYYVSKTIIRARKLKSNIQNEVISSDASGNITLRISYKTRASLLKMTLDINPGPKRIVFVNGCTKEFYLDPGKYVVKGRVGGFFSIINDKFSREITIVGPETLVNIDVCALPSATKNLSVDIH
jgi:hypothetical protein